MRTHTTLACPLCGTIQFTSMPEDRTVTQYTCKGCRKDLAPRRQEHCVFCSYGDTECPQRQAAILA